ncbi:DMT family transporter [Anaeroselena agilis]|uniref:DMT family transporter n=1 Tax=Anaeroselena agilis TaxID=3063788 RepID=A0ABU3NWP6_9FIRM|nr:DMT family transporter [Selenomonadales bacterium 4137-cl]
MTDAKPRMMYAGLLSVAFLWGASFAVAKTGMAELAPLNLVVLRFFVAATIFAVILFFRREKSTIAFADVWRFVVLGFLTVTSYFYIQYTALTFTTTVNAALIVATIPVWTAVFGAALGWERVSPAGAAGIAVALGGVSLIISGGRGGAALLSSSTLPGDLLMLVNALTWAGITLYGREIMQKYPPFLTMAWIHIFGTLLLAPFAFVATPLAPVPLAGQLAGITWPTAASALFLAVLCSVYAYYMWYLGVERLGAVRTASFSYFNPLFAAIVGVLFMGETLTAYVAAGGAIVLAGVYMTNKAARRSAPPAGSAPCRGR